MRKSTKSSGLLFAQKLNLENDMTTSASHKIPAPAEAEIDENLMFERAVKRDERRWNTKVIITRTFLTVVFVAAWQFLSGPVIDEFWISKPTAILTRLFEWTVDGTLLTHSTATLTAMALGFLVGSATGVLAGFFLGRSKFFAAVFQPFIVGMSSLPKLALAPLFILWFGIGLESKVLMTGLVVFFLVFYNTFAGARDTDRELLDVVTIMGAKQRDRLFHVIIPSAASWIFTGLRLAVPYSLIGAVVSEITASSEGLGYILKRSANTFDTAGTFGAIAILVVVALILNLFVTRAEKINARWK
jgi:NitT/TauT family transport system permease protein